MEGLANSDGCRPLQPKFLLCQLLPQTLQPSEFVIFIAKDTEDSSPTPRSTHDPRADNFWFPVTRPKFGPPLLVVNAIAGYNSYFVTRNAGLLLSVPVGGMTETVPLFAPA
jgi:hypothetical protein